MGEDLFVRRSLSARCGVDEAEQALQALFSPVELAAPREGGGDFGMTLDAVRVREVVIGYLEFHADVQVKWRDVEGYVITVALAGTWQMQINGSRDVVQVRPGRAVVLSPGQSAVTQWDRGCAQLVVVIPQHRMQTELEAVLDQTAAGAIEFDPLMDVTSGQGQSWMNTLRLIEQQTRMTNGVLHHPRVAANLEHLVIDGLLLTQPHNHTAAVNSPDQAAMPQVVREAIAAMEAHPERRWTADTLAREVLVSTRSLQHLFQTAVGVPPMRYLRNVRLERVRGELSSVAPGQTTVSQVAARWGFRDLGRFAVAYRQRYGEAPSQSLRRAGGRELVGAARSTA